MLNVIDLGMLIVVGLHNHIIDFIKNEYEILFELFHEFK
jgi:hypothetical protein